jgi:hypothetical protein
VCFLLIKVDSRLTDPIMRENYLRWGQPDGCQEVSIGIALPAAIVNDGWWSCLGAFAYITTLAFVVPLWTGIWWYRFQSTTAEGLYACTAHRFSVASTHFGNMNIYKMAKLMSGCREVVEIVEQYRQKMNIEVLVHLCGSHPTWKVSSAGDQDTPVRPSAFLSKQRPMSLLRCYCMRIFIDSVFQLTWSLSKTKFFH